MVEPERESLVFMRSGADPAGLIAAAGGKMTQRLADRIALAVVPASARDAIAGRPDAPNIYHEDVPDAVWEDLDEAERVIVNAWRQRGHAKQRSGDGLRWDAPGFEAP